MDATRNTIHFVRTRKGRKVPGLSTARTNRVDIRIHGFGRIQFFWRNRRVKLVSEIQGVTYTVKRLGNGETYSFRAEKDGRVQVEATLHVV